MKVPFAPLFIAALLVAPTFGEAKMNPALARTAAEWPGVFERNFNRADLTALLASYTEDAVLDVGGANVMRGREAIRQGLENFLAPKLPISVRYKRIVESGDMAVVFFNWSIAGKAPDGADVKLGGDGVDVLRRGKDGYWRQYLDTPFGSSTPTE